MRLPLMSALGHEQTSRPLRVISAIPSKRTFVGRIEHVCFAPEADISLEWALVLALRPSSADLVHGVIGEASILSPHAGERKGLPVRGE